MENIFEKVFIRVLNEQTPLELPAPAPEMSDADALKSTLDSGSSTAHLDVHAADREAMHKKMEYQAHMIERLQEWITKISEFCKFLNEPGTGSIQSILNDAIPETLMDQIKSSETKRIARVASELGALNEMLKGYMNTKNNAQYRGV